MPFCHMLIGMPAVGKSTWVKDFLSKKRGGQWVWVSSDNLIEMYAKSQGSTYSAVFSSYIDRATELMYGEVDCAVQAGKNIIWDQTNLTVEVRAKKLAMLKGYKHAAYTFTCDPHAWLKRVTSRPDKFIPLDVLVKMAHSYEAPTAQEGFRKIYRIYTNS